MQAKELKKELIEKILGKLGEELAFLTQAAIAAREAATHEESKPEDEHDTRGLEASYLAGAQAQRAAEIQQQIAFYKVLEPRDFGPGAAIEATALVEVSSLGRKTLYFIAPQGAGMSLEVGGKTVQVISPVSPLGEELVGRKAGDDFEIEGRGQTREYEIVSVF